MKIKDGLFLRKVGRQYMLVDEAADEVNLTNVYTLNGTAAYLWEKIGNQEFDVAMLVAWICEKYDVEASVVEKDVKALIAEWQKLGLLVE